MSLNQCFLYQCCNVAKVTIIHSEDFSRFGYMLNMKVKFQKIILLNIFGYSTSTMYKELLLNSSWIPAIENLKNHLNFAVLIFFNFTFWLLYSRPKISWAALICHHETLMSWNGLVLADSVGFGCLALPRSADRAYHTQHNGQWLHHSIEQFGLHPKLGFSDRIYCASLFLTARYLSSVPRIVRLHPRLSDFR